MTSLGKPLVFYLKYMAEMNRLCADLEDDEERDLTGLKNREQVLEMARSVGDAACEKMADYLEICAKGIEDHFTGLGFGTLCEKTKRSFLLRNWYWRARVNVSSVPGGWFTCGAWVTAPPEVSVALAPDVCGVAVPWISTSGGRKTADEVWKILGGWAHSRRGGGLVDDSGMIALACIPIKPEPAGSLDVDRDQLIAEVIKTFARIGAEQTTAIARLVAGHSEPDEG
jgi:hypothetical protein